MREAGADPRGDAGVPRLAADRQAIAERADVLSFAASQVGIRLPNK